MKKFFSIVLALFVTIVVVLLVAPLFYSLDELKPRIEQIANSKVRGEVRLGHLSFSLFPSIKISAENVELHEKKGQTSPPFTKIAKTQIRMSLMSLLTAPRATFVLSGLDMKLVSDSKGDNLKNFLPEEVPLTPEAAAQAAAEEAAKPADANPIAGLQKELAGSLQEIPSFLRNRILAAKFSFEILESQVSATMIEKDSALSANLKELQFQVIDIGFNTPIKVNAAADMNVDSNGIKLLGPFSVDGEVTLLPGSGDMSELRMKLLAKLDGVAISAMGVLDKPAGNSLNANVGGIVKFGKSIDAKIDTLEFQFGGIKTTGNLSLQGATVDTANVALKIESEKIDLAGLATFVPMVRDYKLKGQSEFRLAADGPTANPALNIFARMSGVSGSTPELAKPIENLKGTVEVTGNLENPKVVVKDVSLNIGRSDMAFAMTSQGLAKMDVKMDLSSNLLDADELLGVEAVAAGTSGSGGTPGGAQAPAVDPNAALDETLEEMAPLVEESLKNEMLDRITLRAGMNVKKIRFMGAEYTNAVLDARMANRKLNVKSGNMGAYGGIVKADMDLGLNPGGLLDYGMNATMNKIQVNQAIIAHAPTWKDDVSGSLVGSMSLSGKGLRKAQLAKNLNGKIQASMEAGRLNMPVVKIVTQIMDKLPEKLRAGLGDKANAKVEGQEFRGDFKTMKFAADIAGRTVQIREMDVVYDPQKAKIGDLRFSATGELTFDKAIRFDATTFVSPDLIRVSEWKGASGLVELPMKLTGTMEEPKPDIAFTTKILGERLAKGVAKKEIEKLAPKVIEKIQEKVPEPIKNELEKLKKKFKF